MIFYRRNLPHLQRDNKPHFITFVTKKRWIMPDWARDVVLECAFTIMVPDTTSTLP